MVRKVIIALALSLSIVGVFALPAAATSGSDFCGHSSHKFWRGSHWHGLSYNSGHWAGVWWNRSMEDLYGHVHGYNAFEYHNGQWQYAHYFTKRC